MSQIPPPEPVYAQYAQPAYPPYDPLEADRSYLKTLSILHYCWGGLTLLGSCLSIIYIVMGVMVLNGTFNMPAPPPPGPNAAVGPAMRAPAPAPANQPMSNNQFPREFGYVFIGIGIAVLVFGWTFGLLTIISGRKMAARRSRVFSMVVAGINCISFPLGTALGVFTIIVLSKATVKSMYEQG